ncbi:MAG: glycosyltransferase [Cyanobacteria bacterium RI_101]|nr:glycosyltransferase [Cyanobacteria bacterium RI_101]
MVLAPALWQYSLLEIVAWTAGILAGVVWLVLLLFWGRFWLCDQRLDPQAPSLTDYPSIAALIPARDEAETLPQTLPTLLGQDYPGNLTITLIDDQSEDGTGALAQALAQDSPRVLTVLPGQPLAPGWSGKLWALEQGVRWLEAQNERPEYYLLTDADIAHGPSTVRELAQKAVGENLGLVSLMALLRCQSAWERLLIPAFVFFFQLLYPFPWINNAQNPWAGAAGGCILLRREALEKIGGLAVLKTALIDDCALARQVKAAGYPLWLGLTTTTRSLRAYDSLGSVWTMVARTAYTQLRYNPFLLIGAVLGMALVYLTAPALVLLGLVWGTGGLSLLGLLVWGLTALAYTPTVRLYGLSPLWTLTLPVTALLYTLMTLDSARRSLQGRGGAWKGRVYSAPSGE